MIEVKEVSVSFEGTDDSKTHALKDVSLVVRPSEVVSLVGSNGSGKSTLGSLMCGLSVPDAGSVRIDGLDTSSRQESKSDIFRKVGLVRQHPADQLVSTVVFDEVAFGPRNLGLSVEVVAERVLKALRLVGLEDARDRITTELSGGEQQRLAVAGVLAMEPSYLILDEATSMLDSSSRPFFRSFFARCAHEQGLGMVQITHDPEEVLVSDRVIVLDAGRKVWEGSPFELLCEKANLWDATIAANPTAGAIRALVRAGLPKKAIVAALTDSERLKTALVRAERSGLLSMRDLDGIERELLGVADMCENSVASCSRGEAHGTKRIGPAPLSSGCDDGPSSGAVRSERSSAPDPAKQGCGIVVEQLSFSYDTRAREVLRNVDLAVSPGEVVLLAGASGSGKSTLACLAAGLYQPSSGTVSIGGRSAAPGRCSLAFQRPEDQFFLDTVYDEIAFALRNAGTGEDKVDEAVRSAARLLGLDEELLEKYPFDLSGGQERRVALASVLALDAPAVVLDEPTAGLDVAGRTTVRNVARELADRGKAVLVISHDLEEWMACVDRVALLARGCLTWTGSPDELAGALARFDEAEIKPPTNMMLAREVAHAKREIAHRAFGD